MMKGIVRFILRRLYKVTVEGGDNLPGAGERVLIVANHLSFLDALLLAAFLPGRPLFAVNTFIARQWWLKPFLSMARTFPLDPTNPMAAKALIGELKKGGSCVIFPEGRITVTGSLMKIYDGPGMIADKADAAIVPVRIDGAQYSPFSRLRGKVRIRLFPEITIRIMPARRIGAAEGLQGRARRAEMGRQLYDVMREMMFEGADYKKTLFESLIDARHIHGGGHKVVVDVLRKPMDYNALIRASFALGRQLAKTAAEGEYVGLLLPNMAGTIAAFCALQAYGRVPAMLNFSAGTANVMSACATAGIKTVVTSRKFIETAKLQTLTEAMAAKGLAVVYLEDVRARLGPGAKLAALAVSFAPGFYYRRICGRAPGDAAAVLFTSGSEGAPKGVVLSHLNIQANRFQLSSSVDFGPTDRIFNALPVFHSFGLTAGTILPLLSGIQVFFYPSPLHYRIVPELVYDTNSTIMFGTDTFLSGYARFANPYDFYSLRYVFAGAEKLKEETRKLYAEKYGVRIFEGYGSTETSPVLSTNTPMQYRPGTVGRLMPGIEARLEAVPGVADGGRLFVRGPNVMLGYLLPERPGVLVPPEGGWYDTGDIVAMDDDGFISIRGRAKRFAKIAGEMVSLTAAEGIASSAYPGARLAVVAVQDERKGEALVLVTELDGIETEKLVRAAKEQGLSELMVPRKVKVVSTLPVLGTGKTDYVAVQKMVNEA